MLCFSLEKGWNNKLGKWPLLCLFQLLLSVGSIREEADFCLSFFFQGRAWNYPNRTDSLMPLPPNITLFWNSMTIRRKPWLSADGQVAAWLDHLPILDCLLWNIRGFFFFLSMGWKKWSSVSGSGERSYHMRRLADLLLWLDGCLYCRSMAGDKWWAKATRYVEKSLPRLLKKNSQGTGRFCFCFYFYHNALPFSCFLPLSDDDRHKVVVATVSVASCFSHHSSNDEQQVTLVTVSVMTLPSFLSLRFSTAVAGSTTPSSSFPYPTNSLL